MIWAYAGILLILAIFDARFTADLLRKVGPEVELNHLIKWLTPLVGVTAASWIGVLSPTVVLTAVGLGLKWCGFLSFLCGARTTLFAFQLYRKKNANI